MLEISNVCEGETFLYPLVRLKGKVTDSNINEIKVNVSCTEFGFSEDQGVWPVVKGNFKVAVHLFLGRNEITLSNTKYGISKKVSLTYNTNVDKDKHADVHRVRMVFWVCKDEDLSALSSDGVFNRCNIFTRNELLEARFKGFSVTSSSAPNSESSIKKIQMGGLMMQSFCAESLRYHGLGDFSFTFEYEDEIGKQSENINCLRFPRVHILRSKMTRLEIKTHWAEKGDNWAYSFVSEEIRKASLSTTTTSLSLSIENYNKTKDIVFASMTEWDPVKKKALMHTALGGGRQGLFGGSGFYSWAENVKDIPVKFLDATVIDESKHHNDSCGRGYHWANYSTTLGASMHEAGHMFGLPHIFTKTTMKNGIMSRGFDMFNRFFVVKEPVQKQCNFQHISSNYDSLHVDNNEKFGPRWARSSALQLKLSPWFSRLRYPQGKAQTNENLTKEELEQKDCDDFCLFNMDGMPFSNSSRKTFRNVNLERLSECSRPKSLSCNFTDSKKMNNNNKIVSRSLQQRQQEQELQQQYSQKKNDILDNMKQKGRFHFSMDGNGEFVLSPGSTLWHEVNRDLSGRAPPVFAHKFQEVNRSSDSITLYDSRRNMVLQLTYDRVYWNLSQNGNGEIGNAKHLLKKGRWTDNLSVYSELNLSPVIKIKGEERQLFKMQNKGELLMVPSREINQKKKVQWLELTSSKDVHSFVEVKRDDEAIYLLDEGRGMYLKLTEDVVYWTQDKDCKKWNALGSGQWILFANLETKLAGIQPPSIEVSIEDSRHLISIESLSPLAFIKFMDLKDDSVFHHLEFGPTTEATTAASGKSGGMNTFSISFEKDDIFKLIEESHDIADFKALIGTSYKIEVWGANGCQKTQII